MEWRRFVTYLWNDPRTLQNVITIESLLRESTKHRYTLSTHAKTNN